MVYPLKMIPCFRHGSSTPWGGRALADVFGKDIPDDHTGESLETSALAGLESVVENGELAGQTLSEALELWGAELTGSQEPGFPLLVKLLDAREMLSVQVHPGDEYARVHEGKLGKTEAWVVLFAPRGSKLVYGVDLKGVPLGQYVVEDRLEDALTWLPVSPGDVLYIPHGMVHALGNGIMVYEVQQASDVTYRFWDWGRLDKDGNPRQLHTRKALDVTRCDLRLPKIEGATTLREGGSATFFICDDNFELSRLNVAGRMPLPGGRMLLLTALGDCNLTWPEGEISLGPGQSAVIPAALEGAAIAGRLPVLCVAAPDRQALREALGYRAGNVAGLE